jgi:putative phosphoesterase
LKVALLGDIHGNHLALNAVLTAASLRGVEKLLITGDIVGYYYFPADVMRQLSFWDVSAVRGNHEIMLGKARRNSDFLTYVDSKYGTGLRVALETLSEESLNWLENLPHPFSLEIDGYRILLCHGSPTEVDHYIYPDTENIAEQISDNLRYDWIVLGHTHYPMSIKCGAAYVLNPGSIGQPRNRQPGAHWMLLDTQTAHVESCCEYYDITPICEECRLRDPAIPYLTSVLECR